MTPFDVYRLYVSLKLHFKSARYHYSEHSLLKTKPDTFFKRNDRFFFEKLAKKYKNTEIRDLFVSIFMVNENTWVGTFLDSSMEEIYLDWKKRTESLEYTFKQDVQSLCDILETQNIEFDDLFVVPTDGTYPKIVTLLMQKKICPETYVILDNLLMFGSGYLRAFEHDVVWNQMMLKYAKYSVFLDVESQLKTYRKILVDRLKHSELV